MRPEEIKDESVIPFSEVPVAQGIQELVDENSVELNPAPSEKFLEPMMKIEKLAPTLVGQHLTIEQLISFPEFPKGEQDSLLCKYLTEAVWDEYKDQVDKHGVSFKQCIFSGCKNPDSGIGCYAGSQDSYSTFSKLFTDIIIDYHKVNIAKQDHISNMDYTKLVCPPFNS